jgi:uncharacterized protein (DUF934 family)
MPLIDSDGRTLSDPWRLLAEGEDIPELGPVLVPLRRWLAERDRLLARSEPVGILLQSSEGPADLPGDLRRVSLIALEFPKFTDGRPYSTARLLRERYGYAGELRATGAVLRDQLQFLRRCGFDSFEVAKREAGEAIAEAFGEISVSYQAAADEAPRAADVRRGERTGYEQSKVCAGFWAY